MVAQREKLFRLLAANPEVRGIVDNALMAAKAQELARAAAAHRIPSYVEWALPGRRGNPCG